jgi:hypothetical protein
MRKKTQAYNCVKIKTKYPLRFVHLSDTSTASGTDHSGRLNAGCGLFQPALPILCASQLVELFQPALSFFSLCEE